MQKIKHRIKTNWSDHKVNKIKLRRQLIFVRCTLRITLETNITWQKRHKMPPGIILKEMKLGRETSRKSTPQLLCMRERVFRLKLKPRGLHR